MYLYNFIYNKIKLVTNIHIKKYSLFIKNPINIFFLKNININNKLYTLYIYKKKKKLFFIINYYLNYLNIKFNKLIDLLDKKIFYI